MAMGNRPGVEKAQPPVCALDIGLLAQQLGAALLRVPFRHPLRQGGSNPAANLGISVTREVIRSFMGYSSSLPIPEFRSLELVLDDICKVIMPPVVRALDVKGHPADRRYTEFTLIFTTSKRPPVVNYKNGKRYYTHPVTQTFPAPAQLT